MADNASFMQYFGESIRLLRATQPGPWLEDFDQHPDVSYAFQAHGLSCEIRRVMDLNFNGYVRLPPQHPLSRLPKNQRQQVKDDFSVIGGVTQIKEEEDGSTVWGFDTALGIKPLDLALQKQPIPQPGSRGYMFYGYQETKDETTQLAAQLAAWAQSTGDWDSSLPAAASLPVIHQEDSVIVTRDALDHGLLHPHHAS